MSLNARLIRIISIKSEGVVSRFERSCGLSNGSIKNITHSIEYKTLSKILTAFPDINKNWLMEEEGEVLIASPSIKVPIYEVDATAGDVEVYQDMSNQQPSGHSWSTIAWNDCDIPEGVISVCLGHDETANQTTQIYIEKRLSV